MKDEGCCQNQRNRRHPKSVRFKVPRGLHRGLKIPKGLKIEQLVGILI